MSSWDRSSQDRSSQDWSSLVKISQIQCRTYQIKWETSNQVGPGQFNLGQVKLTWEGHSKFKKLFFLKMFWPQNLFGQKIPPPKKKLCQTFFLDSFDPTFFEGSCRLLLNLCVARRLHFRVKPNCTWCWVGVLTNFFGEVISLGQIFFGLSDFNKVKLLTHWILLLWSLIR